MYHIMEVNNLQTTNSYWLTKKNTTLLEVNKKVIYLFNHFCIMFIISI